MDLQKVEINGQEYHLLFNGETYFKLRDVDNLMTAIRDDYDTFCRVAALMSEHGELYRRYKGYDPGEALDKDELRLTLNPIEAVELRKAIIAGINAAFTREVKGKKVERDIGLEKIKKKTGQDTGLSRARYLRMGTVSGLNEKETFLLYPGMIFDMWELHLQTNPRYWDDEPAS